MQAAYWLGSGIEPRQWDRFVRVSQSSRHEGSLPCKSFPGHEFDTADDDGDDVNDFGRGARAAEGAGLENRCGLRFTVGSNPTLSAFLVARDF